MAKRNTDFSLTSIDDLFSTEEERENGKMPRIKDVPLFLLDDFPNHPFKVRFDDDMMQLVDIDYLTKERGIDFELVDYCIKNNLIFESYKYHNVVFVGYDENNNPRYAAFRSTNGERIMGDCSGSSKKYSFRIVNENCNEVHLFECAIDLLSYATLLKMKGKNWLSYNLLSLSGVYQPKEKIEDSKVPVALERYLSANPNINKIYLHLDNDKAGRLATKALQTILPNHIKVIDNPVPKGKDVNDFLIIKKQKQLENSKDISR